VTHPYYARRYAKSIGHEVPLRAAIGKVAAEEVEVYPPGIPVILEGFRASADAVEYLLAARDSGGSIVTRDTSLGTLRVELTRGVSGRVRPAARQVRHLHIGTLIR
jgi:arginine decarboxylase